MDNRADITKEFVSRKIFLLLNTTNDAMARSTLANMRRGIGKAPGAMPELWGIMLEDLPDALLSRDGTPTAGELASYTALTLFALHQQGHSLKQEPMHKEGISLGSAARRLIRTPEDEARIKRRFDAALTADDIQGFAYYIRGLIQLLKASDIALDYPLLARDLYFLQLDSTRDSVRLRWGQDFCSRNDESKNNNEEV